jgi:hypothetical protein
MINTNKKFRKERRKGKRKKCSSRGSNTVNSMDE